jgi:MYXO-CTERM domain-containing protein
MTSKRTTALKTSMQWGAALVVMGATTPAGAQTKTLIDYFLPTPIVCPLTSNTWGAAGVLPRDVCNGLEDSTGKTWQYWDGKILEGTDGKYHIFAGEWPQDKGFADWPQSTIVEGISNGTIMGSYVPSTEAPFTGKEQNVTGMVLDDGSYALLDSPGNVYTATSLDGPWAALGAIQITANGFAVASQTTENQTIWPSVGGSFEVISRNFQEMVSPKNIEGPYVIQATIPDLESEGYEDPVLWCSGGQYHLVANMYNARKAMHFTSADGIHNWTNMGLAYDPTTDFVRYTDGTINHWYKAERPGVVLQNGHVTAFSFAVIDVDKTLDLANDSHGSKVIVVPFDGVTFDHDNPGPGSAGCPLVAEVQGDAGTSADSGLRDAAADAGALVDAGDLDAGPSVDGSASAEAGEPVDSGGSLDAGGRVDAGGQNGSPEDAGVPDAGATSSSSSSGCSCRLGANPVSSGAAGVALAIGMALAAGRRRRNVR